MLTNAVHFKADWEHPFKKELTQPAPFHLLDGTTRQVPMMKGGGSPRYFATGDYEAVALAYKGGKFSLVLILPKEGAFDVVDRTFGVEELTAIGEGALPAPMSVMLPTFSFSSELPMPAYMKQLGMTDAFSCDRGADLSGISTAEPLCITDIAHKAFIAVDEKGTEAAAATAVVVGAKGGSFESPETLRFDRPFLFALRHDESGALLFLGRVVSP